MDLKIRKAIAVDIPAILNVFDDARSFQRASGFVQWVDGYPNAATVESDINKREAYVAEFNGQIVGYFFIAFNDPGYDQITGIWQNNGDFAVVHRLALSSQVRGYGFGERILYAAEELAKQGGAGSMRIDTGEANTIMQRIMARLNYTPKGLIVFSWGPRLTFEKLL